MYDTLQRLHTLGWKLSKAYLLRHVSPCGVHRWPCVHLSPFTLTPLHILLHSHHSHVCSLAGVCRFAFAQKKLFFCETKDKKKKLGLEN